MSLTGHCSKALQPMTMPFFIPPVEAKIPVLGAEAKRRFTSLGLVYPLLENPASQGQNHLAGVFLSALLYISLDNL